MTPVDDLEQKAMRLGALAAIRSEEYAAAHPEEIARRRLFFRRFLGDVASVGAGCNVVGVCFTAREIDSVPAAAWDAVARCLRTDG